MCLLEVTKAVFPLSPAIFIASSKAYLKLSQATYKILFGFAALIFVSILVLTAASKSSCFAVKILLFAIIYQILYF
jgi:hypothetical protein